jgi:hypothetical protein
MLSDLKETISRAIDIKNKNNLPFVTVWKTGKLYGFNFDLKPMGYETCIGGIKRKVIGVY